MSLVAATAAAKRAAESLGALVDVTLARRGSTRDPVTGSRTFGDPLTVRAKIDGPDKYVISSDASLSTARHTVTLFDVAVKAGDRITFGGVDRTVLAVDGLIRDPVTGERFHHVAVTD